VPGEPTPAFALVHSDKTHYTILHEAKNNWVRRFSEAFYVDDENLWKDTALVRSSLRKAGIPVQKILASYIDLRAKAKNKISEREELINLYKSMLRG